MLIASAVVDAVDAKMVMQVCSLTVEILASAPAPERMAVLRTVERPGVDEPPQPARGQLGHGIAEHVRDDQLEEDRYGRALRLPSDAPSEYAASCANCARAPTLK